MEEIKMIKSVALLDKRQKTAMGAMGILLLLICIAGSWTIPFIYESSSIFYKFGIQKIFLRTGKILGLTAFILALLQLILISRIRILDRVFSLNRLVNFHAINGLVVLSCAVLHPLLVMAAENFTMYPIEKRYWPEFLGMGMLLLILLVVIVSFWRRLFSFSYEQWLQMHRVGTSLILFGLSIHIFFVSDSFGSGPPKYLLIGALGLIAFLLARLWYRRIIKPYRAFTVSKISPAGNDSWHLEIVPTDGKAFGYAPGQFAFITPISNNVPKQTHPFTIASAPTRPESLQFIIKAIGDWTRNIHGLAIDDPVYLDGPFGQFSHVSLSNDAPLIMVAGGIGITPMLSMLRYMADIGDQRRILLIWSNRTQVDTFFQHELDALKRRLEHLTIRQVITSKKTNESFGRRMDRRMLKSLTDDFSKSANLFICGPARMMKQVYKDTIRLGFSSARVYTEKFRL